MIRLWFIVRWFFLQDMQLRHDQFKPDLVFPIALFPKIRYLYSARSVVLILRRDIAPSSCESPE